VAVAALNQPSTLKNVPFSQVISEANAGKIKQSPSQNDALGSYAPERIPRPPRVQQRTGSSIYEQGLTNKDVLVDVKPASSASSTWENIGISLIPVILISMVLFFMIQKRPRPRATRR